MNITKRNGRGAHLVYSPLLQTWKASFVVAFKKRLFSWKQNGTSVCDLDDKEAISEAITLLRRLSDAKMLHPSALFGTLTIDQWKKIHLDHAAHHLSFLLPKI